MWNTVLLQDESLAKKLITKGFWVYFFVFLAAPIGYILRMFLSNSVSVAEVGIFYSVLGLITLLITYNDLGLTESLQYFIPKYWIAGEKSKVKLSIVVSFLMQMITGILIFCGLYFGTEWLASHHFQSPLAFEIIRILAFYFLWYTIISLGSSFFISFQDTFSRGFVDVLKQVACLWFTLFYWFNWSLDLISFSWAWIYGLIFSVLLVIVLVGLKYFHVLSHPFVFEKKILKKHFSYAFWVFLSANVWVLLTQIDQQMVVNILGPEAAGYFSNFSALLMVFTLIVTPLFTLLFPLTTELITKNDLKKFWMLQHLMYSYFWVFALCIAGFFMVWWQEIAVVLFGESFRYSGYLLQLAAPFLCLNCWMVISLNFMAGLGKIKQRMFTFLFVLIVNVILNFVFLVWLGKWLMASAFILSVSRLLSSGIMMVLIYRDHPFSIDWKLLLKNVVVIGMLCLMMWWMKWTPFFMVDSFLLPGINRWFVLCIVFAFFVGYMIVMSGMNWEKVGLLVREVKKLKGG